MLLSTIIASIIVVIAPFWAIVWTFKCWDIAGSYNLDTKVVFVCDWIQDSEFYKYHEIGHYFYYEILTTKQKEAYHNAYEQALIKWPRAFYREYSMRNEQEDFADMFSLYILKKNYNPLIQKRIRLINSFFK